MESTHNQEMQYQPFSGSNQQQQQYNINSNRAGYIDFYRQDGEVNVQTPHNPVITQNMGSASTQREVYSDDNNEVGFDSNALDINNINNMVGGEDYRPSNIKTLYHRDSNSDCEEELASLDMLSGLGGKSMKSDTRRQTIEVASKKILDNCLVDGGMPPVNKLHPNTQFQHKDFDARATNTQLQNGVTNMTNKQSFGGKAGTQNVGGGLSRQKQHNNLEVVLSNNDNAYGLQDQNEQNNYYSQTHKVQLQQNNKQTLAKSQSQNKLLFTSPGELQAKVYATEVSGLHPRLAGAQSVATINYQHPTQQIQIQSQQQKQQQQEKISFFKDQQHSTIDKGQPQGQDLLFKQHLQYSTGAGGGTTKNGGAYQLKLNSGHQHRFLSHNSTKECTYCNKTIGVSSGAAVTPPCSAAICNDNQLGIMIQNDLSKKYSTNRDYYNVKIVNDLIYNENTHVVSIFKDYLILDDINEFLKRSYNIGEVKVRLPKLCSFYDKYSQVFPNFVVLPESKYMFKNIQRKQKLIDEQYQMQEELAKKQHQSLLDEDKMFSSKFYNSIYILNNNDLSMSMKQYEDQAKQISGVTGNAQGGRYPNRVGGVGRIDQMKIDELVDRFLMKDSESNIQLTTTMGVDFSQSMIMMQPGNTSNINNPNKRLSSEFMPIKQQQQNNQQAQQKPKTKPVVQTKQLQQEQYSSSKMANNLMTPASKTGITNKEQPNSKVGKIQQNSIFSATQNISTNNKAPGGTAQLGTSKKVNQDIVMSTTSKKSIGSGAIATQLIQQSNQKRQKSSFNTNNQRGGLGGTGLLTNCLAGTATGGSVVSRQSDQNRLGANSAIGNQGGATQYNTLSVLPGGGTIGGNGGSNNTTPRLNKHFAYTSNQDNIRDQQQLAMHHAQQQQLSPDTKDAVANYLQLCQIEPTLDNQLSSNNIQSIDSGDKKNSGITGNSTSNGTGFGTKKGVYESPNTKSPSSQQIKRHSKKQTALISSGSQNAFTSQSNAQSTLSLANNRQIMRSQLQGGMTSQQSVYTNLQSQQQQLIGGGNAIKKTTSRLSGGAAALRQGSTTMAKKQATSPVPQHIYNTNHQYSNNANSNNTLGASRNTIEQNSTLKSNKVAANLHAKYLSGGNDHYQRILNAVNSENNNAQQQQQQQIQQQQQQLNTAGGIYTTHDTLSTHGADNSASKKFQLSHQQKQPQVKSNQRFAKVQYNNVEGTDDVMSGPEPDLLTGEDCEGVADERLVSPDAFSTDENGRKSLDNRSGTGASLIGGANNMMLASIEGDKVLSQYTNYDQIKKHLERYIQHNHQSTDAKSTFKKFQEQSWDKQKQGGGADGVASGGASLSNDTNNSRNAGANNVGAAQKQFESLKQRIRGVFDSNTNSSDPHNQQQHKTKQPQTIQNNSINKTPIKGSSVSKKSQELAQINNRMSIESREMLGVQPTDQVSSLLSTTSANARAFPFSQTGFVNNYRSTTNLQHRKGSNQNFVNENSVENKRQSQKHPSFKDVQSSGDNKLFKRCATGKTLSINDVQQHNFGLQQQQLQMQQQLQTANINLSGNGGTTTGGAGSQNNTQTLVNPTFINSKMKKSQQQQAANTVRVMTPSYSLASLSKVISPTQTTSPMTMTVTLAGQMQSRKQLGATHSALSKKIGNNSSGQSSQINQLSGTLMQSQSQHTFLLADKASKLISAAKGIQSSNSKGGLSLSSNKSSKLIGLSSTQNIKKQYQPALQQSNSLNNLQVGSTPRGGATISGGGGSSQETFLRQTGGAPGGSGIGAYLYQQQQNQQLPHQEYSYQNMSCTAVSTENNSVKTMESKHPKFMRTIEEYGVGGQQAYNNILSASMGGPGASTSIGQRKITASQSQAQLDLKQKQKLQQLGVANASSKIKKQLLASSSVSHLKTPSQQIHSKKSGGPSGGGSSKP